MREVPCSPVTASTVFARAPPAEEDGGPGSRRHGAEGGPERPPSSAAATGAPHRFRLLLLLLLLLSLPPCDAEDSDDSPCTDRISSDVSKWVTGTGKPAWTGGPDVKCDAATATTKWGPHQGDGDFPCALCESMGVCSGDGLTALPDVSHYPEGMRRLAIKGSAIRNIGVGSFRGLRLDHIEIDDNRHLGGNLDDEAFGGVVGLKALNITRSGLGTINLKWLEDLGDLRVLSLEDNCICFGCSRDESADLYQSDCPSSIGGAKEGDYHPNPMGIKGPLVPYLLQLNLGKNKISHLTQRDFQWLSYSKLKILNLRGITLSSVEDGALVVVSKTLHELDVSDSTLDNDFLLTPLMSSFSGKESSLRGLGLAYLGLNHMPFDALKLVNHTLQKLSLYGNNFHTINILSFPFMSQLQELDLRYCNIKTIEKHSFTNLPKIKTLLLSNNRISNVDGIFTGLKTLEYLGFSHNLGLISSLKDSNAQNDSVEAFKTQPEEQPDRIFPPSLISLDLSFTEIEIIGSSTFKGLSELKNLSVCYSRVSNIVNQSQPFKDLKKLQILDMSGNPWLEMNLSSWIFYGLSSLQELHLDSISNGKKYGYDLKSFSMHQTESPFRSLSNLRFLSMKQNYIHTLTITVFLPLIKLETLYLSNNHIISWDTPLFSENKFLKTLSLHQNQISYISDSMLKEFENLAEISLYGNPILCNCEVSKFVTLAVSGNIKVVDWKEVNAYMCIDKSKKKYETFDGNWSIECETEHGATGIIEGPTVASLVTVSSWGNSITYIIIIIVSSLAVIAIIAGKKRKYFQFLIRNTDTIGVNAYNYDVFVSYCDHDRQWVLNELLPKLEMKNNNVDDSKQPGPAFKVCLHERDFQVGSSILENIMSCMDNSRMILLVVSSTFLRSQWCQFEMHLAQHRLLETRRDDLLLVFLEEIPRSKRPKTLHYLMATKTYIVWNEETKDLFWKRLRHAIKLNPSEKEKSISSFP